jgi:hypothetical protein
MKRLLKQITIFIRPDSYRVVPVDQLSDSFFPIPVTHPFSSFRLSLSFPGQRAIFFIRFNKQSLVIHKDCFILNQQKAGNTPGQV